MKLAVHRKGPEAPTEAGMSRTAARVIAIVYGISLAITYLAHKPPQWLDSVEVSIQGKRTARLFGHEVRLAIDITRDQRQPTKSSPARRDRVTNGFPVVLWGDTVATYLNTRPMVAWVPRLADFEDTAGRSER